MKIFTIATDQGYKDVRGQVVKFPGFEEFTFFIHRDHVDEDAWVVSESTTGLAIPTEGPAITKQSALEKAGKTLYMRGVIKTREAIERGKNQLLATFGELK